MTAEQIETIVENLLTRYRSLSELTYLFIALVTFLASGLGGWLAAYIKEKGKNFATKEDLDKILDAVRQTTRATEEIKATISAELWVEQNRWNLKRDLYVCLLENLGRAAHSTRTVSLLMKSRELVPQEEVEEAITTSIKEATANWKTAVEEIRRATWVAAIMLNKDAQRGLEELLVGWSQWKPDEETSEFFKRQAEVALTTHAFLIDVARKDLLSLAAR